MAGEIRKTILIDAPAETVFRAISDEKELTQWFPDHAKLEPKVGGQMQFQFLAKEEPVIEEKEGAEEHIVVGKILEFVPNKKLSYSWTNTSDPKFPKTVVTWTLEPAGKKTRVTLVHTGFDPKSRWYDLHNQGWSYFVEERLAEYCGKKKK